MKKLFLILGIVLATFGMTQAQSPIQVSLFPPIQIVPENQSVSGIRLAIYGKNTNTQILDFGLVTHNTSGMSKGLQWSFVGIQDDFTGWQASGIVNYSTGSVTGLMTSAVNYSSYFTGLQWGFVNYTKTANGIQIGLLNFIEKGGMLPFFPLFNFSLK